MKKILGGIGGVVALGVLSYPGFGLLVERGVRQQLVAMPKQYGMSVELTDFHRSWFSSQAKILWKWQIPAHLTQNEQGQTITVSPQNYEKEFAIHIFHGPVIWNAGRLFFGVGHADTRIDWPLFSNLPLKSEFTKDSVFPHIDIQMALNFLCQTTWNTSIPPFMLNSQDRQNALVWDGFKIHNKIHGRAQSLKGWIAFKGAQLNNKKEQTELSLKNMNSQYRFKHDVSGLYTGKAQLSLDDLDLHHPNQQHYQWLQWHLNTNSAVEQGLFSTEFVMTLQQLLINQEKMGPFAVDLQISKLDALALNRLHQLLKPEQNASPSFRQKSVWTVIAAVPELLKRGLTVDLKQLHLVMPQGEMNATAHISLAPDAANSLMGLQPLQNLQGILDLNVAQTLLSSCLSTLVEQQLLLQQQLATDASADVHQIAQSRIQTKLASLLKLGVLQTQADNYVMHLKFENGQLSVNNLPFDPAWLIV